VKEKTMFYQAQGNTRIARLLVKLAAYASALLLAFTFCSSFATTQNGGSFGGFWTMVVILAVGDSLVAWYAISTGFVFEWLLERRFQKTCAGLGGSFVGQGRAKFHTKVALDPVSSFTKGEWKRRTIYPKLREVKGTAESWTGLVYPFYGQSVEDYNKQSVVQAFAQAFNVKTCSFERTDGVAIRIRCGTLQVPSAYEYPALPAQPLGLLETKQQLQTVNLASFFDTREALRALPMARDIDNKPYLVPIEGNHILIAGESGSGKNSYTWSLVFGLRQARKAGLVKLWGLDPKRVELSFGREHWDEYADTTEGMVELLEKAVADLLERNAHIQGKARKIEPNPELPLNVIIIDELAYLSEFVPDTKLKKRAEAAMAAILLLGRATGYVLIGCTQSALKDVISLRDHYLTKVGLRMPASQVDLLFGKGAWENGAKCDLIPFKDAGAGCAYVLDEASSEPRLVRSAWVSDEAIRDSLDLPGSARYDLQWPEE
jgi:hypothetical protein